MEIVTYRRILAVLAVIGIIFSVFSLSFHRGNAQAVSASLFVRPASGTFSIGSTFTVSIFVNTGGNSVNAIEANLIFPPDKLQVVSPTTGRSFVAIWVAQPTYNNERGTLKFQGAVPNPGINTSEGLLSQVTFRVTGIGTASLKFQDDSKILLNDGRGTDILGQTTNGVYELVLPPPAGPTVTSPTHPDQQKWYLQESVVFEWAPSTEAEGYSYVLNDQPVDFPDNVSEGLRKNVSYKNLDDGIYYFHIKALREGVWGGVSHYGVKIDKSPPAQFAIDIAPSPKTTNKKPIIGFLTTDALSGLDHYEINIVPLIPSAAIPTQEQHFFIEANSPYIPELDIGDFDVIVRAYDKAGNFVQETQRLRIKTPFFSVVEDEGISLPGNIVISWFFVWLVGGLLSILFGYAGWRLWRWHYALEKKILDGHLPESVKKQLEELKELKSKYKKDGGFPGHTAILILVLTLSVFAFLKATPLMAQQSELSPPIVTVISKNITNEEIFYIGGKTEAADSQIIIYLQNLKDGETLSQAVTSDKNGNWFYTHPRFLSSGQYLLWTQVKLADLASPPSPQIQLTVSPTALQLGASRISLELLYLGISIVLVLVLVGIMGFILYHSYHGRKKHVKLLGDVKRAEESIRRGFALLHRDIQTELALIHKTKLSGELSAEEKELEAKIMNDLERVKKYLAKEIWEIEHEV